MSVRGRQLVTLAGAAASLVVIAFACGFPDPAFGPDGVEGGGPEGSTSNEGGPGTDGGALEDVINANLDAPGDDAAVVERGDAKPLAPDAACSSAGECDCDNDGVRARACDGGDCNDRDPLVRSGQTFVSTPPDSPDGGDWDCSGEVNTQYPYNVRCDALVGGCEGAGFPNKPACGEEAPFVECKPAIGPILGCQATDAGKRRQGCR